ncbi:MAG: O-acetyl-ADP-ribose deacetylase [Clostridia bacterium]|nr:O-acetyl-ADP-ribose deacetylase [Clostridia bacterium]
MPLKLIREDITKLHCDAIVNAANSSLLGGGGVDGAIHRAAGTGLLAECRTLGGCRTGEAKITKGYRLPCKFVIHTVGPVWRGGAHGEEALLRSCYRNSLALAKQYGCESVAFPLISSGVYGYPKDKALQIAVDEITAFLLGEEMLVYIVIYDKSAFQIGEKLFDDIAAFIDDRYVEEHFDFRYRSEVFADSIALDTDESAPLAGDTFAAKAPLFETQMPACASMPAPAAAPMPAGQQKKNATLDDALKHIDESFSEMLLRKIDEKGMTDAECYKKANIDRKLFSKIRSDRLYKPSKTTAIAFAIALELPLEETKDMLMKAGFALSHSNKFDIIIEYFITNGNYNVFEINEALFAFDQNLLGV